MPISRSGAISTTLSPGVKHPVSTPTPERITVFGSHPCSVPSSASCPISDCSFAGRFPILATAVWRTLNPSGGPCSRGPATIGCWRRSPSTDKRTSNCAFFIRWSYEYVTGRHRSLSLWAETFKSSKVKYKSFTRINFYKVARENNE